MKISPLQAWIIDRIGCNTETFSRDCLEQYQLEKLNLTIEHVLDFSPFYKKHFSSNPKNLLSLSDLSLFPLTTSRDIMINPGSFVCGPQDNIQRIVTLPTSGTTGESKRVFFSEEDLELTIDFFRVGMSTLATAGDIVLILLPGQRPDSVGDLLKRGLERLGCSAYIYGPVDDEEKVMKTIVATNSNILVGSPVHIHRLARYQEKNETLPKHQIFKVLTSTDSLVPVIRSNIESILGCEVFDHYGMTETGLGGGVECEDHNGFHLREADLFFEIIDPISGKSLPDGEFGEIVVTTLTRTGMPLIRYRTGDQSRLLSDHCACGSVIKRLDRISGRINSGIRLGTGVLAQSDLDEALFSNKDVIDFSAAFDRLEGKPGLKLEILTCKDNLSQIETNLQDCIKNIPAIKKELNDGRLKLKIIPMVKENPQNPNAMHKRSIKMEVC